MMGTVNVPTIEMDELRRKLDSDEDVILVDALAPMVYAHSHLPGAINIPPSSIDPEAIGRRIPDRDAEIVVYCSSPECDDSIQTAERLQALGYANVRRYAGGKDEWRESGQPLERAGKRFVSR
jgi:rhodanese-related sulfurtransferase